MDVYRNFTGLREAEKEDIDFRISTVRRDGSNIVIIAPHGGAIEPGTSEVAKMVADHDLSFALFEGIKPKDNKRLHITSTNFDEPRCIELVKKVDTVIAIHGEASSQIAVFLGGRDNELATHIKSALNLNDYTIKTHGSPNLQGLASSNICNRGRSGMGIQLELSAGLRMTFFQSLKSKGRRQYTNELIRFSAAIREGLAAAGRL